MPGEVPVAPEAEDQDHSPIAPADIDHDTGDNAEINVFTIEALRDARGTTESATIGLAIATEKAVEHDHTIFRDPRPSQLRRELERTRTTWQKLVRRCDIEARKSVLRIASRTTRAPRTPHYTG